LVHAKFLSSAASCAFFSPPTAERCPEFVQRALNLCVAERFRFGRVHFHTVFNRTVENFYKKFIFSLALGAGMVAKVPCRTSPFFFGNDSRSRFKNEIFPLRA
jgi:hypothetical protein